VQPEGLGKLKNSPHQVSNPRPSGLLHSALTTTLPRAPVEKVGTQMYRVQQANFLLHTAIAILKRKLACRTLYFVVIILSAVTDITELGTPPFGC
jgi:hypothetical protein